MVFDDQTTSDSVFEPSSSVATNSQDYEGDVDEPAAAVGGKRKSPVKGGANQGKIN